MVARLHMHGQTPLRGMALEAGLERSREGRGGNRKLLVQIFKVPIKSKIMSYLADILLIGGRGGNAFNFNGTGNGATLKKIWVWAGSWQIKAIKVWLTDGQSKQFGESVGNIAEFIFEDGEHFTSLSLWGNGAGTRLGGIKFKTNRSREFFAHMTDCWLKTEYPVDVGSGICIGLLGRSGADIDSLGFMFINTIRSTELTHVQYPTFHDVIPNVAVEDMKSMTYRNNSTHTLHYTLETSKKITKRSSWSVTNKLEFIFSLTVKADIPEVAEIATGFVFTLGSKDTYTSEYIEEKTKVFLFPIKVPPGKTVDVDITIGRTTVDLPYTGTVQITCYNGGVLQFPTSGIYRGVTYTKAKVVVNKSAKNLAEKPEAESELIRKTF